MAKIGWCRTALDLPTRGGDLTSRFKSHELDSVPAAEEERISEEKLLDNYRYFIRNVLPAAEKANVGMGLHPDDPPISPLRGVGRIFTSPAIFSKAMELSNSPSHGITFCQANFVAMGENLTDCITGLSSSISAI